MLDREFVHYSKEIVDGLLNCYKLYEKIPAYDKGERELISGLTKELFSKLAKIV